MVSRRRSVRAVKKRRHIRPGSRWINRKSNVNRGCIVIVSSVRRGEVNLVAGGSYPVEQFLHEHEEVFSCLG